MVTRLAKGHKWSRFMKFHREASGPLWMKITWDTGQEEVGGGSHEKGLVTRILEPKVI